MVARAVAEGTSTVLRIPPTTDLLDLVLSVVHAPETVARPGGVLVLVPSVGWAERLCGRLVRRGYPATTDWAEAARGLADRGGKPGRGLGPAARGLGRPRPRCPRRVLSGGECADLQRGRRRHRKGPAGRQSLHRHLSLPADRGERRQSAGHAPRGGGEGRLVGRGTGGSPRRRPAQRPVLRRVRAPGPRRARRPRRGRPARAPGVLLRPDGSGPPPGLRGLRGAGPVHDLRCGRGPTRDRPAMPALWERAPPRLRRLREAAHEDAPGRGVTRLREEVAALLGAEVGEVSGPAVARSGAAGESVRRTRGSPPRPGPHRNRGGAARVRRAAAVVFLDIDLHLLAPRFSATDETLALLVRASRMVGPRHVGPASARLLVQTRVPDHPVLQAVAPGGSCPRSPPARNRCGGAPGFRPSPHSPR